MALVPVSGLLKIRTLPQSFSESFYDLEDGGVLNRLGRPSKKGWRALRHPRTATAIDKKLAIDIGGKKGDELQYTICSTKGPWLPTERDVPAVAVHPAAQTPNFDCSGLEYITGGQMYRSVFKFPFEIQNQPFI